MGRRTKILLLSTIVLAALALASMGAAIGASSDGPGQGAEFHILLQATKSGAHARG